MGEQGGGRGCPLSPPSAQPPPPGPQQSEGEKCVSRVSLRPPGLFHYCHLLSLPPTRDSGRGENQASPEGPQAWRSQDPWTLRLM